MIQKLDTGDLLTLSPADTAIASKLNEVIDFINAGVNKVYDPDERLAKHLDDLRWLTTEEKKELRDEAARLRQLTKERKQK